jgi:AmpD protein
MSSGPSDRDDIPRALQRSAGSGLWGEGGILLEARQSESPNQDDRPPGEPVRLLVVHNISLPPGEFGGNAIERFFANRLPFDEPPGYLDLRGMRVSAHFLIRRQGELVQFVPCDRRAWHAGKSRWAGRDRCNDFSVGVELEGTDVRPYTDAQYARLAGLTGALMGRYPITDIVGHGDIAPERKTDPGPAFDWARYRALLAQRGGTPQT